MICKSIQTFLSFIIFYLAILPRPCRHVGGWIDCGVAGKKFSKSVDFVSLLSAFFSFPLPCSAQIQDRAASPFRPSIDAPFRVWTSGADHCVWFMIRSSLQIACMKQLFVEWRICFQKVLVFCILFFAVFHSSCSRSHSFFCYYANGSLLPISCELPLHIETGAKSKKKRCANATEICVL